MGRAFLPLGPMPRGGVELSCLSLRIVGLSGHSGKFVRGSGIYALGSFEVLTSTRAPSSGFVIISVTHLFSQKGGFGQRLSFPRWVKPWSPLSYKRVGSSEAPIPIHGDPTEVS
jgi:hypothetical protein